MTENAPSSSRDPFYDVVIVGGGAAGLSAAQMLGRSRRSVVVVDSGDPRNAPAQGVHGFLSRDGISPAALLAAGRAEVASYGGVILRGEATAATGDVRQGFGVTLDDGSRLRGRRLLIATGLVDELPDIPGLRERWGKDVLHCPFCHGWEVQDQAIGILGNGPWSVHQGLLFRQWSSNITLFLNDRTIPSEPELEQLAARGVKVVAGAVETLRVEGDALRGVALAGGPEVALDALVVGARTSARLHAFTGLGLSPSPHPMGIGDYLETDADGATAVPGVWAAGNVTDMKAQVLASAASAAWTAVVINNHLMAEEMERDLAAYRESQALTGA
ncbi:NAD(P)/FAD-dependent oxidoreductase [Arthrobacter nitrophenolicus]|uniref:NAD(P)/FAD-dependent oxidoreductase n=2 Tax=Arthrobacter nitrophenolicus TaxID=683150 RepID=UPI00389A45C5